MHGGRRAGCSGRSVPPRTSQSLSEGRSPTACKVNLGITLGIGQLKKIYIFASKILAAVLARAPLTLRFCSRVHRQCLFSACV